MSGLELVERGLDCGDERCHDLFWEFVYIIIIPAAVLFLVVFITSIILCCHSCCKRKKSDVIADETQMSQYNSIRRASLNLRVLSHNRDTPLLTSRADRDARTASLNLEGDPRYRRGGRGTASAPGTLTRDRERRHQRGLNRHSAYIPSHYSNSPVTDYYQTQDDTNNSLGVQYAELNHGAMSAVPASALHSHSADML